jgi:hypothetical protein
MTEKLRNFEINEQIFIIPGSRVNFHDCRAIINTGMSIVQVPGLVTDDRWKCLKPLIVPRLVPLHTFMWMNYGGYPPDTSDPNRIKLVHSFSPPQDDTM